MYCPRPETSRCASAREHRDGGVQPSYHIRDRDAHLLGTASGPIVTLPRHAHQAAQRLNREVVTRARGIGSALAESRDRAVDEAWIELPQALMVQTVPGQVADLVVLEEHVGLGGETPDDVASFRGGEIDGERPLAAIGAQVVRRFAGVAAGRVTQVGRSPVPRVVARAGPLDLDHLGAQVGQDLARPGPREHARAVQDAELREGAGHVRSPGRVAPRDGVRGSPRVRAPGSPRPPRARPH